MSGKWKVYERTRDAVTRIYHSPQTRREKATWRRVGSYANEADARKGYKCRADKCPWSIQLKLVDPTGHEVARHTPGLWISR